MSNENKNKKKKPKSDQQLNYCLDGKMVNRPINAVKTHNVYLKV